MNLLEMSNSNTLESQNSQNGWRNRTKKGLMMLVVVFVVAVVGSKTLGQAGSSSQRHPNAVFVQNAVSDSCPNVPTNEYVKLKSQETGAGYMFVCAEASDYAFTQANPSGDKFLFKLVAGLNGAPCSFSLESKTKPGFYLSYHSAGSELKLSDPQVINCPNCVSFTASGGLTGTGVSFFSGQGYISVTAANFGLNCNPTFKVSNWGGANPTHPQSSWDIEPASSSITVTVAKEPFSTYANMANFIAANGCPNTAFEDPNYGATGANILYDSIGCEVTPAAIKIRVKIGYGGSIFRKVAEYTMTSSNSLSCIIYKQTTATGALLFLHHGWTYRCNGYETYLRLVAKGPVPMKALPQSGVATAVHNLMKQSACPSQVILKSAANTELALFNSFEYCEQQNNWNTQYVAQQVFSGNVVLLTYVINSTPGVTNNLNKVCLTVWSPTGSISYNYACHVAGTTIDLSGSGLQLAPAPFVFTVHLDNMKFVY